jgi:hypothetical protein
MNRTSATLGALLFLSTSAANAAGPDRKACIAAADDGQKLRDDGKLTAARDKFITCASKACPGAVAKECSQWLQDTERDMPSVTFRARDERGKDILDVRVFVDDQVVAEAIDARALPVDPGEHKFRFDRSDGKSVEDKIVLRPAEKNRLIELSFEPPKQAGAATPADGGASHTMTTPPPEEPGRGFHVPVLGWVGAGVAVVGVGMTALFAIQANDDESTLRASGCAPSCPESERDAIDSKVLLANVGLGVAAVGLGVAVVSTILANSGKPAKTGRLVPTVAPSHGGASLGLGGTF